VIEKRNTRNVSVINNVFPQRKAKRKKSDINISNYSWRVITLRQFPGKSRPVRVVWYTYQIFAFFIIQAQYGMYDCSRMFLNKYDVKVTLSF